MSQNGKGKEPLAIVGIGLRLPGGAKDTTSFWNFLCEGRSGIREVPTDRWNADRYYDENPQIPGRMITRWGGFIDDIEKFDARYFGISPREALRMDPQQRWLLEVAMEAMEDGGHPPEKLSGTSTGVYVGIASNDYANIQMKGPADVDVHTNSGSTLSIASNRISYLFNLKGPSISVDTACSSALVAINLGCQSIWDGQCDAALAGGVNALITPDSSIGFSKASMLSPSGQCFAFDERANGYVRGEGAGMLLIRPLSAAMEDGDPIYAVIRAAVINQDGRTNAMTVPGMESQSEMLEMAYEQAGIPPSRVNYMEAHGTGTPVGDPIEVRALGNVLCRDRDPGEECVIGSVKTNVGHLESGSGVAGIIKAALVLRHRKIPPNLNFAKPNPNIPFDDLRFRVPVELEDIPENGMPAVTAVNSFGFGGTNAHIVLEEAPREALRHEGRRREAHADDAPVVFPISAKTEEGLKQYVAAYREFLTTGQPDLGDVALTAAVRKDQHEQRLIVVGSTHEEISERLHAWEKGEKNATGVVAGKTAAEKSPLVFVFTGQGPQWWGMGQELLKTEPVFRKALEEIDGHIRKLGDWSLLEEMTRSEEDSHINRTYIAQPAIFAIQVGLAELWRSRGVEPDLVIGHSVGEVGAAYWAGIYTLEDAVKVIYHRSRLQETTGGNGRMAAVGLSKEKAEEAIKGYEDAVKVAVINSPSLVTLAGDTDVLEPIIEKLEADQVFARWLRIDYAFHTHQMEPIREELLAALEGIDPHPGNIPFVSTVTGNRMEGSELGPEYWWRNVRETVLFSPAISKLVADGHTAFLELGPHPALASSINECLAQGGSKGTVLPSLRRNEAEREMLLQSLGALHIEGYVVDWEALYGKEGRYVRLPVYPWQHEVFWLESEESKDYRLAERPHPLLGVRIGSPKPTWECALDPREFQYLRDHRMWDSIIFPAAGFAEIGIAVSEVLFPRESYVVEDVKMAKALFISEKNVPTIRVEYDEADKSYKVFSSVNSNKEWELNAHGRLQKLTPREGKKANLDEIRQGLPEYSDHDKYYAEYEDAGYQFGPNFQHLVNVWRKPYESLAEIVVPDAVAAEMSRYHFHPAVLDACFHCVKGAQVVAEGSEPHENFFLPAAIRRVRTFGPIGAHLWGHANVYRDDGDIVEADIEVFDEAGEQVAEIRGFRVDRVDQADAKSGDDLDSCYYQFSWMPSHLWGAGASGPVSLEAPSTVVEEIDPRIDEVYEEYKLEDYFFRFLPGVDVFCTQFVINAFDALGWKPEVGDTFTFEEFTETLAIIPQHHRLSRSFLKALTEDGFLRQEGEQWKVARVPEVGDPKDVIEKLRNDYPLFESDLPVMEICGRSLPDVLSGRVDSLEVLFPGGSFERLRPFYTEGQDFLAFNSLMRDALSVSLAKVPERRTIRILEVGAGTGSLTSCLLPVMPADRTEFTFTDNGPGFIVDARKQFSEYDFVDYRLLDIEKDPVEQGFDLHSFDVILATNVIHATADLKHTLGIIRSLLAPEGTFMFLEVTRQRRPLDLVFGLLKGWWSYTDTDLRTESALLPRPAWESLLSECGFADVSSFLNSRFEAEGSQTVFVASGPAEIEEETTPAEEENSGGAVVLIADKSGVADALAKRLSEGGRKIITARPGDGFERIDDETYVLSAGSREDFARLIAETGGGKEVTDFVHALCCDHPESDGMGQADLLASQQTGVLSVLALTQALSETELEKPPRVWLVTQGAQAVSQGEVITSMASTPVIGLVRVANNEHSEFQWASVDLDVSNPEGQIDQLFEEIMLGGDELEVAYRGGWRFGNRLKHATLSEIEPRTREAVTADGIVPYRLEIATPGVLTNLALRETTRREPGPTEIEVAVAAGGVNFRDVMKVLGMYPGESKDLKWLGDDFSGTVVSVGEKVKDLKPGDTVVGMAPYCFRSYVTIDRSMVFAKPDHISFQEAASLPTVYLTAHYALNHLARLRKGERVLIHAGTGGVGQAAIRLAQNIGAEVFSTAGTPEKREFLREMGVPHVMDSRSLDFADEIMEITDGRGVDVVLNSLAGDFIPKNFSVLAPFGRFLEIGKIDIYANNKVGLEPFRNNISYFAIDLAQHLEEKPDYVASLFSELSEKFEAKELPPLPINVFSITDVVEAFRYMAQGKHIGKNILSFEAESIQVGVPSDRETLFRPDATYLITGGLGGFGFEVAKWMAEYGARHLALMGRSGAKSQETLDGIEAMRARGIEVAEMRADVTLEEDVSRVLRQIADEMPPLKGVVHGAMVIDDEFIKDLDAERFEKVLRPKMIGAWLLHSHTSDLALDHFISFSSISCVVGAGRQSNYNAGNFFLDALAHYRNARGLPALTINWGALTGAGFVERNEKTAQYLDMIGMKPFTIEEALKVLERVLEKEAVQFGAARIDWKSVARFNPTTGDSPMFSLVGKSEGGEDGARGGGSVRPQVMAAAPEDRQKIVEDFICEQVSQVFGTSASKIDRDTPLTQIGLDSLMAIELMNRLESNLGINLPMSQFLQGPNIRELAVPVLELLLQTTDQDDAEGEFSTGPVEEKTGVEQLGEVEEFPLTVGQRALWFLNRLAPDSSAYNLIFSSKVTPRVDIPVMEKAFATLFRRHPMLDVIVAGEGGNPMHRQQKSRTIDFREHDTSHLDEEAIKELIVEHATRPFDLENGPVIRLELYLTSDDAHIAVLSMHHIVSDAWSVVLLMNDLIESYFSYRAGAEPQLKPVNYRYSDFVNWHQKLLDSPGAEKMREFWVEQLTGAPLTLDLPTDHPRPALQTFNGATYGFKLEDSLTDRVVSLSSERNVTLYTLLLSAFQVLLHKYCSQDDLVVGSPMAGRNRPEFHDLVGYFINPVALRSRVDDDPSFVDYLDRVGETVIGALENQDYPLPMLVDRLKVKRDPSRSPVFQVTFSMERIPGVDEQGIAVFLIGQGGHNFEVGDIAVESIDLNLRQAQFDFSLVVEEAGGNIYGCWQYNSDLFEPDTIARLNSLYEQVLEEVVAHPEKSISELSFLSQDEEKKILEEWNHTDIEYPEDQCLHQLVADHSERTPNSIAVTSAGKSLTYTQLNHAANGLGHVLQEKGIAQDVPVGIFLDRSVEMLVGVLGILKSGGCYVPMDPSFPKFRLQQMLEDAAPPVIVTHRSRVDDLPDGDWELVYVEDIEESQAAPQTTSSPESLAYIIYTSGSTGVPKGVEIPHRAVVNFLFSMREIPGLVADDTLLAVTTLSFDISVLELFLPLLSGAQVVIATRDEVKDARRLSMLLDEYAVTTMQATPAMWQMLLDSGWNGKHDLRVFCGGEPLPRELAESLLPSTRAVWNLYGPTETTIWSTVAKVSSGVGSVSVGRPIANTTIYILDEKNNALPPGFVGRLYIGGVGLARGYHKQPELTAERFIDITLPNGKTERLYDTGDLARFLPDGKIDVLGRVDSQIKLRGVRMELGEIEAHLRSHGEVKQAVVLKRDDLAGGEGLAAYIIPDAAREGIVADLREYLSDRLPESMRPSAYLVMDEFPLTPNKKIDRRALPAPTLERAEMKVEYAAPQTPSETILIDILTTAFQSDKIGIRDNFFELGGDSLLAVQVLTEISKIFNRHLPVEVFLRNPTVENLARYLDTTPADADAEHDMMLNGNGGFGGAGNAEAIDGDYLTLSIVEGRNGDREDLPQVDSVALAYIPDAFMPLTGLTREEIVRNWFHDEPLLSNVYHTPYGKIGLVMLPRLGAELYKDQDVLEKSIVDALELSKKAGAKQVSLTGLIPSATDYGKRINEWVGDREDLPLITTGHATTTATIIKSMDGLLRKASRNFAEEKVAIVGLGSIGYASLRLMLEVLPHPCELILCDLYQKLDALESIRTELRSEVGFSGEIRLEPTKGQLPEAVYEASFLLGATNVPGILDVNRLRPGALIVDDSFPPCFRVLDAIKRAETEHDLLFTTGGLLRLPTEIEETIFLPSGATDIVEGMGNTQLLALAGRDPHEITGCILSSLLTGSDSEVHPTIGPVAVEESLAHYKLLEKLDLEPARPQCEHYFVSDETIEAFKKKTASGPAPSDALQGV